MKWREAVSKFNNKYNLSLNAKSLNIDDLKEINFDFEDVINISQDAFWEESKSR
jgi:hypothetical protein